ncbi:hypothetical protein L1885_26795, partial [Streptomyces fuscigenes]|nr:hypothetical protein [Streptomyces fuscigenes]
MSSDQHYPYDPARGHGAPPPQHAGGPRSQDPAYGGYEPGPQGGGPSDLEQTQTWQGQTWDTASQPVVERPAGRHAQQHPRHQQQPYQPDPQHPGHPYEEQYGHPRQPGHQQAQPSYGPAAPHRPGTPAGPQQHLAPQPQPGPYQGPSAQSSMEETAYLPTTGAHAAGGAYAPQPAPGQPASSMEETAYLPATGAPYAQQSQQSQQQARSHAHRASHAAPPGPAASSMEETAYLPATGAGAGPVQAQPPGPGAQGPGAQGPGYAGQSGAYPLPPEVPAAGRAGS